MVIYFEEDTGEDTRKMVAEHQKYNDDLQKGLQEKRDEKKQIEEIQKQKEDESKKKVAKQTAEIQTELTGTKREKMEKKKENEPQQKVDEKVPIKEKIEEQEKAAKLNQDENKMNNFWLEAKTLLAELKNIDDGITNNKVAVKNFGQTADSIKDRMKKILDDLKNTENKNEPGKSEPFKVTVHEQNLLKKLIESNISLIFTKNLEILKENAIERFTTSLDNDQSQMEWSVYFADSYFVQEAERSIPTGTGWNYIFPRESLQKMMIDISKRKKLIVAEKIKSGEQQAYSFQLLQQQQAQLHSIQQQQLGGAPTLWNVGIAYRPPDSIFNISAGYQQGKANIQLTMIPDEHASLLGATGFTAGVGPGNLGLSLNLNI